MGDRLERPSLGRARITTDLALDQQSPSAPPRREDSQPRSSRTANEAGLPPLTNRAPYLGARPCYSLASTPLGRNLSILSKTFLSVQRHGIMRLHPSSSPLRLV